MAYSQAVEQWRSLVAEYFRPEDVEKAMYVLNGESSGRADARSTSGGYGLFQLNDGGLGEGLSIAQRLDPRTNVKTAAAAVYGGQGWKPWGEGSEIYNYPYDKSTGKGRFGSLGNNPYPGGSNMSNSPTSGTGVAEYQTALTRMTDLLLNQPERGTEAYDDWMKELEALSTVVSVLRPRESGSGLDPAAEAANADFNRKIQQVGADISLGNLNLSKSIADIDRFLGGKEESRARSDLVGKQKDAVTRYGAAPGKTAYSGRDMGGVGELYSRILGKGLDDPLVNYSGTQWLDVEGDLARYDQQMGVTGQMPGVADVGAGISVPQASAVSFGGPALPGQGPGQIDVSGGINSVPLDPINQPSAAGTLEEPGIAKTPSPGPTAVTPSVGGGAPLSQAAGQIDLGGQTGIAAPPPVPWWISNANGINGAMVGR